MSTRLYSAVNFRGDRAGMGGGKICMNWWRRVCNMKMKPLQNSNYIQGAAETIPAETYLNDCTATFFSQQNHRQWTPTNIAQLQPYDSLLIFFL